jgi:hypothetical protein
MMPEIKRLSNKISKIGWFLREGRLPVRDKPAHLNVCVHTEMLYDSDVYKALLNFSKDFRALTGVRMAACVATPLCPLVGESAANSGVTSEEFASRLLELADSAEIGYHGHFYNRGHDGLKRVSRNGYDKELVVRQLDDEMDWLKGIGIRPKIYIAGWWFLTEDIVLELERRGIEIYQSVRKGKTDTFGAKYLDDSDMPDCGRPFFLPPSKNILEIQSLFGPVMMPPLMKAHIAPYMEKDKDEDLYFVLALHDWDIPRHRRNIWSNIRELDRCTETVRWMNIPDMRNLFLSSAGSRAVVKGTT